MKYGSVITGGIVATLAMTMLMLAAPMMGMPKMNVGEMLSGMMGLPVAVGWILHFMIGVIFALIYSWVFNSKLPIGNYMLRGIVYGALVFIFAQIMFAVMRAMGIMPSMGGDMVKSIAESLMGHLLFGFVLSFFFKDNVSAGNGHYNQQ
jgi:uncharacterized BrkB/YihY/UPF0761 family membrane protein